MRLLFKPVIFILIVIVLVFFGFSYLMRGCLSKYDERSSLPNVLYFKNDTSAVIFSIVRFDKTTSYSQNGGFIQKTITGQYLVQNNNATTGEKIHEREIKENSDIKNYPVELLGIADNKAWAFINELMAFDPFTLEEKVNKKLLEEANPQLKDRFPTERKYYRFNNATEKINITAKDGTTWVIDATTLKASPDNTEADESPIKSQIRQLEIQMKDLEKQQDSLYDLKMRKPYQQLTNKEITVKSYSKMTQVFSNIRNRIYQRRDSLQDLKSKLQQGERAAESVDRRIKSINDKSSVHFSQLKINADTLNNQWFGICTANELDNLYERFDYQTLYNDASRRQLYRSNLARNRNGENIFDKSSAKILTSADYFLDGGFLIDKETGKASLLSNPFSFLIISKTQLGEAGTIRISRIDSTGNSIWEHNTELREWSGFTISGNRIIITGTDNKELSGSECNVLWTIDLANGKGARYDFFTDKIR